MSVRNIPRDRGNGRTDSQIVRINWRCVPDGHGTVASHRATIHWARVRTCDEPPDVPLKRQQQHLKLRERESIRYVQHIAYQSPSFYYYVNLYQPNTVASRL